MSSVPVRASSEDRLSSPAHSRVRAVEHIRRMRGGAQSHLMRCSDGNYYVVKFQNNPQHRRILVNELLGTRLAEKMGLPTTPTAIVHVSGRLIDMTDELVMELPRYRVPCSPGLQFGSRYYGNPKDDKPRASIPRYELPYVNNVSTFVGMVIFDKWVCNTDGRQFLFLRGRSGRYSMVGIDQGFCFNQGEWNFPDAPMWGFYFDKAVYRHVRSMDDFEPWLSRIETEFSMDTLLDAAKDIPPEWYDHNDGAFIQLLEKLNRRRTKIRELLREWCPKLPLIFPHWGDPQRYCTSSVAAAD
jgi:hypothetical protein